MIGFGTSSPVPNDNIDPQLSLLAPSGGETWYIGDTQQIIWNASDTNLSHGQLWYSYNGGETYVLISDFAAATDVYPWEIPPNPSQNTRIKISAFDAFGNSDSLESTDLFSIIWDTPLSPNGISIYTLNGVDVIITWQEVTSSVHALPISPDGYILFSNEIPFEIGDNLFEFLGEVSSDTSFTHFGTLSIGNGLFYRVVAYKDTDGRVADLISFIKRNPEQKISYSEFQTIISSPSSGGAK